MPLVEENGFFMGTQMKHISFFITCLLVVVIFSSFGQAVNFRDLFHNPWSSSIRTRVLREREENEENIRAMANRALEDVREAERLLQSSHPEMEAYHRQVDQAHEGWISFVQYIDQVASKLRAEGLGGTHTEIAERINTENPDRMYTLQKTAMNLHTQFGTSMNAVVLGITDVRIDDSASLRALHFIDYVFQDEELVKNFKRRALFEEFGTAQYYLTHIMLKIPGYEKYLQISCSYPLIKFLPSFVSALFIAWLTVIML